MAMQLSIDEKGRAGRGGNEGKTGEGWLMAGMMARIMAGMMAGMISRIDGLGRLATHVYQAVQRARGAGSKRKRMELVESLPLGNRRQLMLVVCNNRRYLVGAGADSVGSVVALKAGTGAQEGVAKGPELVRRRSRAAAREARAKAMVGTRSGLGLDLWH